MPHLSTLLLQLFTNGVIYMHKWQDTLACTQLLDFLPYVFSKSLKKAKKKNKTLKSSKTLKYIHICVYDYIYMKLYIM